MKSICTIIAILLFSSSMHAQIIQGFDGYTGPGTEPVEWAIANGASNNTYTTAGNFGTSSPSVRLDLTGESITSPVFAAGTALQFWGKGQGLAGASTLLVEEFVSGAWGTVTSLSFSGGTLLNTITTYGPYALTPNANRVRFTFTKVTGNMAIDDIQIVGGALPVVFSSFSGYRTENLTKLSFTASNSEPAGQFNIEKSATGNGFTRFGTVTAITGEHQYRFEEVNTGSATAYYRVAFTANGSTKYSPVIKINAENKTTYGINRLTVQGSNIEAEINIEEAGISNIQVLNVDGKVMSGVSMALQKGTQVIHMPFSARQGGLFIFTVGNSSEKAVRKFVLQ
jgi:hypothetical protein